MYPIHFELSLLFILPNGVGQQLSKPPAESKLQWLNFTLEFIFLQFL